MYNNYKHKNRIKNSFFLQLETPIFQSNAIGYIRIPVPENGKIASICDKGLVMGFGLQNILLVFGPQENPHDKPYNPKLQCVELQVVTDSHKCLIYSADLFGGKKFCTLSIEDGTDACKVSVFILTKNFFFNVKSIFICRVIAEDLLCVIIFNLVLYPEDMAVA